MKKIIAPAIILLLCTYAIALLPLNFAAPESIPGRITSQNPSIQSTTGSLEPVVTETGKISMSIDGLGVYPGNTGIIQVEKPAGATVRKAFMAAATIASGGQITDGDIEIDGVDVVWDIEIPNDIYSYNYWAEVTSIVKAKIDAAPAGRIDFTITENAALTHNIDGELLAVIFDDPTQTTDNTVVLLFGAQERAGDTFAIGLAEPLDLSDPNLKLDFSLGISYSYQSGDDQFSYVDVNGIRMTSWAGGEDECGEVGLNGKLFTVGGLDDSNSNPPDPNASPVGDFRYDDELYNLLPFVEDGDTTITVYTQNPSMDDNILFAALYLASATAVVGEGIVLSPATDTNPINTQHTVVAKVQDDLGNPVVDREVTFEIVSGPNAGMTGTDITDQNGNAEFTYTGNSAGTDVIVASCINSQGQTIYSNRVTKGWTTEQPVGGFEAPPNTLVMLAPWLLLALASFGAIIAAKRRMHH